MDCSRALILYPFLQLEGLKPLEAVTLVCRGATDRAQLAQSLAAVRSEGKAGQGWFKERESDGGNRDAAMNSIREKLLS
jgi:hypothetical protein